MKRLSSLSIHHKLMLIVMATTSAALLAALVTLSVFDQLMFRKRMREDAVSLAQIVANNSSAALTFNDARAAEEALKSLRADPSVAAAAIYDEERMIFAQYTRPGWNVPLPAHWSGNSVTFGPKYLAVSEPIVLGSHAVLGTVLVQTDLQQARGRQAQGMVLSATVLLIAVGLGYLLAGRLQRFISGPIHQLAETSRAVAIEKNYSVRVPRQSDDELGRLVDSFNEMLSQIEKRDAALQQAQAELEQHVEERTHDLFEANTRLNFEVTANVQAREESEALRTQLQSACERLQHEAEERAGVQEALRRSEERFSKAFRASPMALAILTRSTSTFVDVNDRFSELVGLDAERIIGSPMFGVPLWSAPETRARIEQLLADGQPFRNWECRISGGGDQSRPALLSAVSFMLGGESCVLLMTEDISERANLEVQLRQAQKMEAIGQLASGVAHDFNNLLTIIQGHTEIVLATLPADGLVRQALQRVISASQRAAQLTGQLLTFGRKQVAKPRRLDVNDVVNNVTSMLRPLLGEKICLRWNGAPGLPAIEGDAAMLEQVIVNLAVNARDAMSRGGDLILSTFKCDLDAAYVKCRPQARAGRFVCLQVSDSGCGMDAATLERIFEPFFTTKGVGKGTGLGLATAYSIVKQHHGWIEVASHVGVGSTFSIFLPVTGGAAAAEEPAVDLSKVSGGHETILVVEDEPALRELVTTVLRNFGYQVLEASHGKEALSIWRHTPTKPALLLTDMMMPEGMTGWELAEKLRAETAALKVVFTSGYSPELFGTNVRLQGRSNFLPKPFHPRNLARTVRQCLDN
jgi:PAS domain S-box-containing protein